MINFEYLYQSFTSHFSDKTVVLYGTGIYSRMILENCNTENVLGVVDRTQNGDFFAGKRVISIHEAMELQPTAIIITGELTEITDIYYRIWGICHKADVALCYMTGADLRSIYEKAEYYDTHFLAINEEELKKEIRRHEVISFDIFDTLLTRRVSKPSDVFDIVEFKAQKKGIAVGNFKEFRKRALTENQKRNPTIYEIYFKLQELLELSDEDCAELCELEIQTEIDLLVPRKAVVNCLKYADYCGKKVYLVSDMYMPADVLERILSHFQIRVYTKIFVSCDYRQLKYEGLFNRYREETKEESYLHIGDSMELDGIYAGVFGIDFFLLKSPFEMLERSTYSELGRYMINININESLLIGQFISGIFNNPFIMYFQEGKPVFRNNYDIGYFFISPLAIQFMIWFVNEIADIDADGILFSARDGYLFQKLYHIVRDSDKIAMKLKDYYLLTSRIACVSACTENEDDIRGVLDAPYECSPREVLMEKYDLGADELTAYQESEENNRFEYGYQQKEVIFQKSRIYRSNYSTYCLKIGLKPGGKYFFFDLVSRGTSQFYLSRILGAELTGIYFWRTYQYAADKLKNLTIKSWWTDEDRERFHNCYTLNHYLLLEAVFSDEHPSVKHMDEFGNPVYGIEMRSDSEIRVMKEIQEGIEDNFREFVCDLWIPGQSIGKKLIDMIYSFSDTYYTTILNSDWKSLMLVDEWMNKRISLDR